MQQKWHKKPTSWGFQDEPLTKFFVYGGIGIWWICEYIYLQKCSSLARSWEYKTQRRSGPTGSNTPRLKVWNSYSAPYTAGYIGVSLTLLLLVSTHIPSQFVSDKTISKNNDLHRDATKSPKSSISFWMFLVYPHLALQVFFTLSQRRHLLTDVLLAAESALCDSTLAWQLGMRNLSLSAPRGMLGWAKILIECLIECWWLLMLILRRFSSKVQKHPFCGGSQQTSGCWWARFGVYFLFLCLRRLRWLGAIKPVLIAPCLIWAVWEGGSKCAASSLNLLERIEVFTLSSDPEASAAPVPVAPCNDWSILQYCTNCRKCTTCGLNLLRIPEVVTDCPGVTTRSLIAPRNNRSICHNCSKCATCRLNLLHASKLSLDIWAVTTRSLRASGKNRSICQNCSKSTFSCLKLLHVPQQALDSWDLLSCHHQHLTPGYNPVSTTAPQWPASRIPVQTSGVLGKASSERGNRWKTNSWAKLQGKLKQYMMGIDSYTKTTLQMDMYLYVYIII